jgi:hypothetical protein
MEHELQLGSDGSAEYRLDYAISEQAISQFAAMSKLRRDLTIAAGEKVASPESPLLKTFLDPSLTNIREYLTTLETYGVTVRSIRENTRVLWRDFSMTLDIEDLERFSQSPLFTEYGFDLEKNEQDQYVLKRKPLAVDAEAIPPSFSEQELEQIRPFVSGFETLIKIRVPGRIISTTAHRTALQTATWQYNFDQQPQAVHRLMQEPLHIVFMSPTSELPMLHAGAGTE